MNFSKFIGTAFSLPRCWEGGPLLTESTRDSYPFIFPRLPLLPFLPDYRQSLKGLPVGSREREAAIHTCHERGAERLRDLCFRNGGIYIKLGQHIGQLVSEIEFSRHCLGPLALLH